MIVKLFDIQNKQVTPSEHCYTLKFLKAIMDKYPKKHLKIYQYLFYKTCPIPDHNPYFHIVEEDKEEQILSQIQANFSPEDELIPEALKRCEQLYETPSSRAYDGIKQALDNIAKYMGSTQITDGKDGNIGQIRAMAKDFDDIRQSYKGTYKDLIEEQQQKVRGDQNLAYDDPI